MGRSVAIIPVLNEREAITDVVESVPANLVDRVIVVDGGSHDGTATAAKAAGATVVVERRRGYGRAIRRGLDEADDAETVLIFDGNGSVSAETMEQVFAPVRDGEVVFSIGIRRAAALRPAQWLGNQLAITSIGLAHGVHYRDVGSVRAITRDAYDSLNIDADGYGWPVQLLARVAAHGLSIRQVEITLLPRRGRSKVSGTLRGKVGSAIAFSRVLTKECGLPALRRIGRRR